MRQEPGRAWGRAFAWVSLTGLCLLPVAWAFFVGSGVEGSALSPPPSLGRTVALTRNTVAVAGGAAVMSLVTGLPYGLLVARTDVWLSRLFQLLLVAPVFLPAYVSGTGWVYALGAQGFLNTSAKALVDPSSTPLQSFGVVASAVVLGLAFFPLVALATAAAARRTSSDLEDAARLSADSPGVLRRAVLPYVIPSSLAGAGVAFLLAAGDFGVPALFGVNVLTVEVYEQFAAYYNARAALAALWPLVGVVFAGVALSVWSAGRTPREVGAVSAGDVRTLPLGRARLAGFLFCTVVTVASVLVPMVALFKEAAGPDAFVVAWGQGALQIRNTAAFAALSATLVVLVAFPAGYFGARGYTGERQALKSLAFLSLAIPGGILGIGLIGMLNRPGVAGLVYQSPAMVSLGLVCRFFPVAALIGAAGIGQVSADLEEPARLEGAGWLRMLRVAVLPYVGGWTGAAWLAVFALCAGELSTSVLVSPPGYETLPVRIFGLMHFGASSVMAALSLTVAVLAFAPAALAGAAYCVWRLHGSRKDDEVAR